MPMVSSDENPQWIQELTEVEHTLDKASANAALQLENYFSTDVLEDLEDASSKKDKDTKDKGASDDQAKKMKSLKKDLKDIAERVDALEEIKELNLPECDDPAGAVLSRISMKHKKKTLKLVYGIVKEYAGSDNADPARIPVLFRELFELCVTGNVSGKD